MPMHIYIYIYIYDARREAKYIRSYVSYIMRINDPLVLDAEVSAHCGGMVHSCGANEPGKFRLHRAFPNQLMV